MDEARTEIAELRALQRQDRERLDRYEAEWYAVIGRPATRPLKQPPPRTKETAVVVWKLLVEYFNEEELSDLAFETGVDYETLAGKTKQEKAKNLVLHFVRRGLLQELIEFCQAERPGIEWPLVPKGKET